MTVLFSISSVQLHPTVCDPMHCSMPGFSMESITNSQSSFKLMSIESAMPAIQPSHPLSSLLLPPSIFPSIRVFSSESVLHIGWPEYCNYSISPSSEYSGLISFGIDQFDFLGVQGTLNSSPVLQFKSIKSSALSFLYSSTLTSIHDYWKNHSFD